MTLPAFNEARVFYRAAFERFEDAEFLYQSNRNTASVYLAGYGVECILKSVILASIASQSDRANQVGEFRGARAHSYEWLKQRYSELGGSLPGSLRRPFSRVNSWATDIRYMAGAVKSKDAKSFLDAALEIIKWADGRL